MRRRSSPPALTAPTSRAIREAAAPDRARTTGALSMVAACLLSCSSATPSVPRRDCSLQVWHRPARPDADVRVLTSWQGWQAPGTSLPPGRADGLRLGLFDPPPGEQAFAIVEDGAVMPSEYVGTTTLWNGREVSWVSIDDCGAPALTVRSVASTASHAHVEFAFLAARDGAPLDRGSVRATDEAGNALSGDGDVDTGRVAIDADLPLGKHTLTLEAADLAGRTTTVSAHVWIEASPFDWRDAVIYQVVTDRFAGDHGVALTTPTTPTERAGGTFGGISSAIDSGALASLGVNTLWISPIYQQPDGDFAGADGRPSSGYHGYWPAAPRTVDSTMGGDVALDALVADAHAHGLRVLFDVVPHHVHRRHPYYLAHGADGWFSPSDPSAACVCGTAGCDWSTHIQSCWFASFLPNLDWTDAAAADQMLDDLIWQLDRFDADGLRIDAIPMMPRMATRRIVDAVRRRRDHADARSLLLGETFTGPGDYAPIRYQLGPFGLDSEFDFPLMWSIRASLGDLGRDVFDLAGDIESSANAWQGSGAVMSLIIGNHDVARFASHASNDDGGDAWSPAPQSTDPTVYARTALAQSLILTLPGAPVVYYGDELALAGRSDPDCRRVMPAATDYSALQRSVRDKVAAAGQVRRCSVALRRGDYQRVFADAEHLAFVRTASGDDGAERALVVLTRHGSAPLEIATPLTDGNWVDALSGEQTAVQQGRLSLPAAEYRLAVYFPEGGACVSLK